MLKVLLRLTLLAALIVLPLTKMKPVAAATFTGSISSTDPTQLNRLFRDPNASTCSGKAFPGVQDVAPGSARHYDAYAFTNYAATTACIQVSLVSQVSGAAEVQTVAYLGGFDPTNIATNYLGDGGFSSIGQLVSYSFSVPAGASFVVVANERNPNSGTGYTLTVNGIVFRQVPGAARDIAIGASGATFVIGTSPVGPPGNFGIYSLSGGSFLPFPGAAVKVAVDPSGKPWVINAAGAIFQWNGSSFVQVAGSASDIAIGADGSVWVIGAGGAIFHLVGGSFVQTPGAAVHIAVAADGSPWVINSSRGIFHLVSGSFNQVPGAAQDIDAGPQDSVWVIGLSEHSSPGNFGVFQLLNGGFLPANGAAVHVAVGGPFGLPWLLDASSAISQGLPTSAAPLRVGGTDPATGPVIQPSVKQPLGAATVDPPRAPSRVPVITPSNKGG